MPLRQCTYLACQRPAERSCGDCMICSGHFCETHRRSPYHRCHSETEVVAEQVNDPDAFYAAYDAAKERHLSTLMTKLRIDALISIASRLRDGVPCSVPAFADGTVQLAKIAAQMGGQNCHLDIEFADGVIWLARLRLDYPTMPPKPVQDHMLLSEFCTLRFLERASGVPTPKAFHYAVASADNPVGVAFILLEKMPGSPLDWNKASQAQRTKIMEQLVDVFLELERYPLPATGSLVDAATDTIGGFAQVELCKTPTARLGPFHSPRESWSAIVRHQMELTREGELCSLPVDHYLSYRWRLEVLPAVLSSLSSNDVNGGSTFILKHFDDKGDHILVDQEYNITAIIDWEFASAEVKELAFSSPCMMWPVRSFYEGANRLALEEEQFADLFEHRGRADLADLVRNGRRFQRFLFFLGGGLSSDRKEFEALFQGLRASVTNEGQDFKTLEDYVQWREDAIKRYSRDDQALQRLLREEKEL
ncbi:MAG: hypothetical protein M1826_000399 [Phylliscum demangeonii]|nr:MAG: hypothetical protein M1826_000399 [Phylliscum demangeonii]